MAELPVETSIESRLDPEIPSSITNDPFGNQLV